MRPLIFLLVALISTSAQAHLQLYRQGRESAGSWFPGDRMGGAVISGDFNGDGYDDIAAGVPFDQIQSLSASPGSVIISYGSYFGITHVGAVQITPSTVGATGTNGMEFGAALAVADFNQDGFDDLVIGAPGSQVGMGSADRGEIFIMKGSAAGLVAWIQMDQSDAGLAIEAGDRFGESLAVGNFDVDASNYPDLMVGSPGENGDAGIIAQFISNGGNPKTGPTSWFDEAVLGGKNAAGNRFGSAMAVGNLVSTAAPDLAVSSPGTDIGSLSVDLEAGLVWVMPGIIGAGIAQTGATSYSAADADHTEPFAEFGKSLAVGVFQDAGGYASLAVGEPNRTVNSVSNEGRVVVFPGGAAALDTTAPDILDAFFFNDVMVSDEHFGSALAAGNFQDADGYDDLAIGGYNDAALPGPIQSGQVFMARGSSTGFSLAAGLSFWDQYDLNEQPVAGDELGFSVCFGAFDGTNKGGIAAGAPGEGGTRDYGAVYVIAPWRQEYGIGAQRALVLDCEDNWVYSLKPFQNSYIASITKIMTVLIAVERIQLGPGHPLYFDPGETYTAGGWESTLIPGSKYHFGLGEQITNWDMLYACLLRSGNDAAFAIAHSMMRQPPSLSGLGLTIPLFVNAMNAKAAALGMSDTHFHNPAGLDVDPLGINSGGHHSTVADYVKLCRAAMDNPLFALIAGSTSHPITRHFKIGTTPVDVPWTIWNIFGGVLNNMTTPMNGIKGGSTTRAQATGCFSAIDPGGNGMALVNTFYTPFTISDAVYTPDAARLMQLGLAECGSELIITPAYFQDPVRMPSIHTASGIRQGMNFEWMSHDSGDVTVSGYRNDAGADEAHAIVELSRYSEILLGPNETVELGSAPFQRHNGLWFTNMNEDVADFYMTPSYDPGNEVMFSLNPSERDSILSYDSGAMFADVTFELMNPSSTDSLVLAVDEVYEYDAVFPPDGSMWMADIKRNGMIINDGMDLIIQGTDAAGNGGDVSMTAGKSGSAVGVFIDPHRQPSNGALSLRPAAPNPFSDRTSISFDLARAGSVELRIFDSRGRQVRDFGRLSLNAGRWTVPWDGKDQRSSAVSGGVYFYKLLMDGQPAGSGKLSLVR